MRQHRPSCLEGPRSLVLRRRLRRSAHLLTDGGLRTLTPRRRDVTGRERLPESGVRLDLVRRVREELAAGTYLTAEKWDAALTRLLGGLGE